MHRRLQLICTVAFASALHGGWPALAQAGEGAKAVSVYGGPGVITLEDEKEASPLGGVLGLEFERSVSDAVAVRASLEGALYRGAESGLSYGGRATVGLTYAFDVIKYVPYAGFGLGAAVLAGGVEARVDPHVELLGGLDILQSRRFSYGVSARVESFLVSSAAASISARATWRWDFF